MLTVCSTSTPAAIVNVIIKCGPDSVVDHYTLKSTLYSFYRVNLLSTSTKSWSEAWHWRVTCAWYPNHNWLHVCDHEIHQYNLIVCILHLHTLCTAGFTQSCEWHLQPPPFHPGSLQANYNYGYDWAVNSALVYKWYWTCECVCSIPTQVLRYSFHGK